MGEKWTPGRTQPGGERMSQNEWKTKEKRVMDRGAKRRKNNGVAATCSNLLSIKNPQKRRERKEKIVYIKPGENETMTLRTVQRWV